MNWFNIKMKDGTVYDMNETQYKLLKRAMTAKFSERPVFFVTDKDIALRLDYIAHISPDKEN